MKQATKSSFETDWLYMRRYYHWRAGIGKYIKRHLNKRTRRDGRRCAAPGEG